MSGDDWFVGRSDVGTFAKPRNYSKGKNLTDYHIEKRQGVLYLVENGGPLFGEELKPMTDDSIRIVKEFSDKENGEIETMYEIKEEGDFLFVILYKCDFVRYYKNTDKKVVLYLESVDEETLYRKGLTRRIKAANKGDVVSKLSSLFIKNDSIFVQDVADRGYLMIYGNRCAAEMRETKPGLYVLEKIRDRNNNDNPIYSMVQVYGNVKFILNENLWEESESSADLTVSASTMFRTWEKYMSCEMDIYKEKLEKYRVPYVSVIRDDDQLIFELENKPSFDVLDIDFKFISEAFIPEKHTMPETADEIIYFLESVNWGVHLDKPISVVNKKICFRTPDRLPESNSYLRKGGLLIISDLSMRIEHKRRNEMLLMMKSGRDPKLNMVMEMCEPGFSDKSLPRGKQIDADKEMRKFLKIRDGEYRLNEQYGAAIDIALRTPDIALIQGPPGTGKTTLISFIVDRLKKSGQRVLVSSEQHTALRNVVGKIASNSNLPPFVISRKARRGQDDSEDEDSGDEIEKFQKRCIDFCNDMIGDRTEKEEELKWLSSILTLVREIRGSDYNPDVISRNIKAISDILVESGQYSTVSSEINSIIKLNMGFDESDAIRKFKLVLKVKLKMLMCENEDDFINDGKADLVQDLQDFIITEGKVIKELCGENTLVSNYLLDDEVLNELKTEDEFKVKSVFNEYLTYIKNIEELLIISNVPRKRIEENIALMIDKIRASINDKKMTKEDIIETFSLLISDVYNARATVLKYTDVIGSTCAQANKAASQDDGGLGSYHYVVIDEAARANPLDILIPLRLGSRVLMVGDHNQLPHYYELEVMRKAEAEGESESEAEEESYIKKSLFKVLYENLSKSNLEFPRTIMLNEQHRMHPSICKFISDNFYQGSGGLVSAKNTFEYVNDYDGVYEGKNIVYIDVQKKVDLPDNEKENKKRKEQREKGSRYRDCEVDEIKTILHSISKCKNERKPTVGIISYYLAQVNRIEKMVKESFPNTNDFSVKTVDTCQGLEYDIVIISGVRSNENGKLGFLQYVPGRINVSLSRAKRLLIFIGDSSTLDNNVYFRNLREYCKNEECGHYEIR